MKDRKLQRWGMGILVCVVLFMASTETNWWHWPLLAIPFLVLIGWVQKKEIEANAPKPMATQNKQPWWIDIWSSFWGFVYNLTQKRR